MTEISEKDKWGALAGEFVKSEIKP